MSEETSTPVLATLPGRLRDWALAALGSSGALAWHELASAEAWPAVPHGVPALVLLDEPGTALADLIALGLVPTYAAGRIAAVLALASETSRGEGPRLIIRGPHDDAATICQRSCAALALPDGILAPPELPALRYPTGRLAMELTDGFLAPLQGFAAGGDLALLRWPRGSFHRGDPSNDIVPERLEIVGPARSLIVGPYLHLPTGWWEADLRLYFSEEARRRTFKVDMVSEDIVGTIRLKPTSAGIFDTRMTFHNPRADWPLALRIALEYGAIEGRLGLEGVTLRHSRVSA